MAELPNDGLSPPFSRGVSLERSHFDVRFELWLVLVVADFFGRFWRRRASRTRLFSC